MAQYRFDPGSVTFKAPSIITPGGARLRFGAPPGTVPSTSTHSVPVTPASTSTHSVPVTPASTSTHSVPVTPASTSTHSVPVTPASTSTHSVPVTPSVLYTPPPIPAQVPIASGSVFTPVFLTPVSQLGAPPQIAVPPDEPTKAPTPSTAVSTVDSTVSPAIFQTSLTEVKLEVGPTKSGHTLLLNSPDTLKTLNAVRHQVIREINPQATFQSQSPTQLKL